METELLELTLAFRGLSDEDQDESVELDDDTDDLDDDDEADEEEEAAPSAEE